MLRIMTAHVRRERRETGAAAVEFALVAMLLLTILVAIIQFSIYFWAYQVGAHAANEGARRYAVDPCNTGANNALVVSRVGSAAAGATGVSHVFAQGIGNTGGLEPGDTVTVTVTFSAPSIGGPLPSMPTITKSATARVEDVPSGCV